jgi:hypothetical protein
MVPLPNIQLCGFIGARLDIGCLHSIDYRLSR